MAFAERDYKGKTETYFGGTCSCYIVFMLWES